MSNSWSYTSPLAGYKSPLMGFGTAGADVAIETIVRPFADRLHPRWPTPVVPGPNETAVEPEAYLEWGAAGDFTTDDRDTPVEDMDADGYGNSDYPRIGYKGNGPSGGNPLDGDPLSRIPLGELLQRKPEDPQDKAKGVHEYKEIDRQVQRTKIWNPVDNEDWMTIERITTIRFRGPKGQVVKFNMRPPEMMAKPDTSGSIG